MSFQRETLLTTFYPTPYAYTWQFAREKVDLTDAFSLTHGGRRQSVSFEHLLLLLLVKLNPFFIWNPSLWQPPKIFRHWCSDNSSMGGVHTAHSHCTAFSFFQPGILYTILSWPWHVCPHPCSVYFIPSIIFNQTTLESSSPFQSLIHSGVSFLLRIEKNSALPFCLPFPFLSSWLDPSPSINQSFRNLKLPQTWNFPLPNSFIHNFDWKYLFILWLPVVLSTCNPSDPGQTQAPARGSPSPGPDPYLTSYLSLNLIHSSKILDPNNRIWKIPKNTSIGSLLSIIISIINQSKSSTFKHQSNNLS